MTDEATVRKPADFGFRVGTLPAGPRDQITDVAGVRVGLLTLNEGHGALNRGAGPIRTGVTVIQPHLGDSWTAPVPAGFHRLNGKGDMSGIQWLVESGALSSPIALTGTGSLGTVRQGMVRFRAESAQVDEGNPSFSGHPVVGETNDSFLNDIAGFHLTEAHVAQVLTDLETVPAGQGFAEGNVGGGTGMICHQFKGGAGSASRIAATEAGEYTVGVYVQANHGVRERLAVNGAPVGRALTIDQVPAPASGPTAAQPQPPAPGEGSIIVIVATDAPLLSHQLRRLAERAGMGIARTGGAGEYSSGDFCVAFSTANHVAETTRYPKHSPVFDELSSLTDKTLNPLYWATIEAAEAAIVSALINAQTMTGRDGNTVTALAGERLAQVLYRFELHDLTKL